MPEGKGESRGAAVVEGRGGVGQAEAEDGGHRHEEEGQGGEEEGKLKQDFNIDCLNIIMTAFIFFLWRWVALPMSLVIVRSSG